MLDLFHNAIVFIRHGISFGISEYSAILGRTIDLFHNASYNQRNYAELAMRRFKCIFGNALKARALPQQKTEVWIATQALNRMTQIGMPTSVKKA